MKTLYNQAAALAICAAMALAGCASGPAPGGSPAKPALEFVDLQSFDSELQTSLSAPLQKIDVAFLDRITPSAMPERLQYWMNAVQAGGGSVKVVRPESGATTRSLLLLINLLGSSWTASEAIKGMSAQAKYKAAHAFDAQILLKVDDKGETVVDRVVFLKK
ncbi:MAG: hypothetical protein RIS88_2657 [Pseudomonadota bacterium]|jgi:hypothetical protein